MNSTDPIAFLSYVRTDDEHERGRITALRQRLEGEVRIQTGRPFVIFQDKKDILWGQQWKERLDTELFNVTFLIPIITPSYFRSAACRDEFEKFVIREKQLGKNTLILPIYYLEADEINEVATASPDAIAAVLSQRNWADWRMLRFTDIKAPEVERSIAEMAKTIKVGMRAIEAEIRESEVTHIPPEPPLQKLSYPSDLTDYSPDTPEMVTSSGIRKPASIRASYYAYTKEFDEVINAEDLIDADSEQRFRAEISRKVRRLKNSHGAAIATAFERLSAIILTPPPAIIFLVDNSGSLKDETKIPVIASWLQVVANILEDVGVSTEVLGFTTRTWKGGESREKWLADGKPTKPGRLNDLRHIVYKDINRKSKDTYANLGLMAAGRLLKENIDGEALLWAYDRARDIGSIQTIIVMISDGAPVDDSTLYENSLDFLERHLNSTIQWLSALPSLHLYGVGIDHDTSRYYPEGIPSIPAKDLGLALLDALPAWLSRNM
ncbi:cobaltochelatase CobT-related protein [Agrobacterium tumefaciens]|uniref:cobaltochelatase CobT-related protein n=1 Tax=Agrobacterium tumefaciens TaxID=358 RepID=UPI00157201E1|nr:TIR domain-containing protein [Agrobacterium tumefaciens]